MPALIFHANEQRKLRFFDDTFSDFCALFCPIKFSLGSCLCYATSEADISSGEVFML